MSFIQIIILQGYLNLFLHFPINTLIAQTMDIISLLSLFSKFAGGAINPTSELSGISPAMLTLRLKKNEADKICFKK